MRGEVRTREQAVHIASAMAAASAKAVAKLQELESAPPERQPLCVVEAGGDGNLRLHLDGSAKPWMEISREHFDKLTLLHSKHGSSAELTSSVFALLLRYQALAAHGYQAALPPEGFTVLHDLLGVGFECFASPLNCRFPQYCSAFPNLDAPFGSVGSFFSFTPRKGSFEANPPFVPDVMLAAVRHAEALLEAAEAATNPLSFVFVVPRWEQLPFHNQLIHSRWLRGKALALQAEEHGFVDGAQHVKNPCDRKRESSFGSTVAVLQSSAAMGKWPVTEELATKLQQAFAAALPEARDAEKRRKQGGGDAVALLLQRRHRSVLEVNEVGKEGSSGSGGADTSRPVTEPEPVRPSPLDMHDHPYHRHHSLRTACLPFPTALVRRSMRVCSARSGKRIAP